MEETHWVWYGERVGYAMCSPTQEIPKPSSFGFLWRLRYVDLIE